VQLHALTIPAAKHSCSTSGDVDPVSATIGKCSPVPRFEPSQKRISRVASMPSLMAICTSIITSIAPLFSRTAWKASSPSLCR
jgi:hypothetical protein